jgi:hypothetical protein
VWFTLRQSVTARRPAVTSLIGCWWRQFRWHSRPTLLHFDETGMLNDLSSHLSALTAR